MDKKEQVIKGLIQEAWNEGDTNPKDKFGDFLNRAAHKICQLPFLKMAKADRKQLKDLSRACFIFLRRMDEVMKDAQGNPIEAGKTTATLANMLEMENDKARYFNLGIDYRNDDKGKEWQSLKARSLKEGKDA